MKSAVSPEGKIGQSEFENRRSIFDSLRRGGGGNNIEIAGVVQTASDAISSVAEISNNSDLPELQATIVSGVDLQVAQDKKDENRKVENTKFAPTIGLPESSQNFSGSAVTAEFVFAKDGADERVVEFDLQNISAGAEVASSPGTSCRTSCFSFLRGKINSR